jgi:hypothetical protein
MILYSSPLESIDFNHFSVLSTVSPQVALESIQRLDHSWSASHLSLLNDLIIADVNLNAILSKAASRAFDGGAAGTVAPSVGTFDSA